MNCNKKSVLRLWIGKVWGKPINSISDLQDGCFFLHVMKAISHCSQQADDLDNADAQTKLLTAKKFLQDFYSTVDFNGVLDFDRIFSEDVSKREMELAKVAMVLLGVALIDKQGGDALIQKASMELPDHLHSDVVGFLEAVVQTHNGPKFSLSSRIEEVLKTPSEETGDIALESWFQLPKSECLTTQECNNVSGTSLSAAAECSPSPLPKMSTPLARCRKGSADTPLNMSFGVSSPFRDLNINAAVSPFVTYIQSPQLIHKAVLKEKELELRQLKAQLNEQILLKEDVQLSLTDQMAENTKKDSKLNDLKTRIKELQFLQDAYDELQEIKPKFADLEAKCDKFVSRQQKLDQYKTECRMLEKETTHQRDEIHSLHLEIQSLKSQIQEKSEKLMSKSSVEKQVELLKVQLEEATRMKTLMEEDLMATKCNLQTTEEKYKELKKLTEESHEESFQGESMGVITDIQLVEMKVQVDRLSQDKDDLNTEIHGLNSTITEQNSVLDDMKKQIETSQELNESLVTQLRGKCTDIEHLKSDISDKEEDSKNALAALRVKHDEDLKALRLENERKVLSLIEGHEVSVKRLQTATEKVSLEKDSIVQEMKEIEDKMRILKDSHTKEMDLLKTESEKQFSTQKLKYEQDFVKMQEENELKKNVLITEHEEQVHNLQNISEQKLFLEKEESEIHLMKIREELLAEMKSQKSEFETQISELQEMNEQRLQEKNELENSMASLQNELVTKLESEKLKNDNVIKELKEVHENEMVNVKTKYEKDMSILQGDSKSQVTSLEEEIVTIKENNVASLECLKKEHEIAMTNLTEELTTKVKNYEKERDDLHKKLQNTEEQKITFQEDFAKLQETTANSLETLQNNHANEISTLLQENNSKIAQMEEEHRNVIDNLEFQNGEKLAKQQDEFETDVSKLQQEISEHISQKASVDEHVSVLLNEQNELRSQLSCQTEKNSELVSEKSVVEDNLMQLKVEHSEVVSAKELAEDKFSNLSQEKSEIALQIEAVEEKVLSLQEKNTEITSQKLAVEEELNVLQQNLSDVSSQKSSLEKVLTTVELEKSEILSEKTFIEEELACLRQETTEVLSEKNMLEEKLANLHQEMSEIISNKESIEESLSRKEQDCLELKSENAGVQENLLKLQEESSLSLKSLMDEHALVMQELKGENEERMNALIRDHQEVTVRVQEEKAALLEEINNLKQNLDSAIVEAEQMKSVMMEKENLASATQNETLEKLVLEREEHKNVLAKIQAEAEERLSIEKSQLEDLIVKQMTEEAEAKFVLMKNEMDELTVRSQKGADALECEKEEHKTMMAKFQEEAEHRMAVEKEEFERKLAEMKEEMNGNYIVEQHEKELMKKEIDALTVKLQEGADALEYEKEEHKTMMAKFQEADHRMAFEKEEFEKKLAEMKEEINGNYTVEQQEKALMKNEMDALTVKLQEGADALECEKEEHKTMMAKFQEADHRMAFEKEEFEKKLAEMKEEINGNYTVEQQEKALMKNEIDALTVKLQEGADALECEKEEHKMMMAKFQDGADLRMTVEKEEFERKLAEMKEEMKEKLAHEQHEKEMMKNEMNELTVKLQEGADALECEVEEHRMMVAKFQEEADHRMVVEKEGFETNLAKVTEEMNKKLALEQQEKEMMLKNIAEERIAEVQTLQQKVDELLNDRQNEIENLKQNITEVNTEKSEMVEKLSTLQEETTEMMQFQKGEHEREMQSLQETHDAKIVEVTAECQTEIGNVRTEMEAAASQHKIQLEEELSKVRQEFDLTYEASLEDLRVKFETAKESELKALSDQKTELLATKEQYEQEIQTQQAKMDQKVKELQEENKQLRERETAMLKNMEAQMATANDFCTSLRQQLEAANAKAAKLEANSTARERLKLYEQQLMKQKETNVSLNNALQIEKETSSKMQQRLETHMTKHEKTKAILENAQKECRVYAIENNRLKTTLDYSERKLTSYKHQLEQAGNVIMGSDARFKQTIAPEERDAEMMDDSLNGGNTSVISSYSLRSTTSTASVRSKGSAKSDEGSPNETIISADSVMLRRETLGGSHDLRKMAPPPAFKPNMVSCDNEPEEFEWDRLSELKRRNTMCLPHLKSCYAVETQAKKEEGCDEQTVRLSMKPADISSIRQAKRRSPRLSMMNDDADETFTVPNKRGKDEKSGGTTIYFPLVRDGAVYQPPGALPTRSTEKQKLVASGTARKKLTPSKLTKSPGKLVTKGRTFKSPGVKGKSPARARNPEAENQQNASVSFSIGFTPKKSGPGRSRLLQKKSSENHQRTSPQQDNRMIISRRSNGEAPDKWSENHWLLEIIERLVSDCLHIVLKELYQGLNSVLVEFIDVLVKPIRAQRVQPISS